MSAVAFGPFPSLSVRAARTLGQTLARLGLVEAESHKGEPVRINADSIPDAATISEKVTLEDLLRTRNLGAETFEEIRAALKAAGAPPSWPAFPPAEKGTAPIK